MLAEQLTDGTGVFHGEGPVWSDTWGGLRWVDMLAGDVLTRRASDQIERVHVGTIAAVIRPRVDGGCIVALENTFAVTSGLLTELATFAAVPHVAGVRLNEGGCDPAGRFYCGSMAYDETPGAGTFYRVDPDGTVSVVESSVTISNGFAFSPDHQLAYYVDTPLHRIDVFDYSATDGLANRRRWTEVEPTAGGPDGLTVDAEGGVWLALMGGSAVRRYAPDGQLDMVIDVPVRQVTACTFGGDQLDELYITTSRIGADLDRHPASGELFIARPGVAGLPVLPFAG